MQFIIYALLVIILTLCFVIFLWSGLYENEIREANEKLEDISKELELLTEWLGEDNSHNIDKQN